MYQPHEVVVRTGGDTLNYSYNPSIDSKENNVIAYEYKFGNVMERKTGVNLKSINTDNLVEIKYAYLSDQWDKESELVGEDVFTLQKLNNEGDEVYIYILISPNEDWDEVNFSTNVVWYYGIPTQMNIINTNTNTTIKQDIITGQEIETPNIELEDGYEASWYLDKECTIPATFPLLSSVTLYAKIEEGYPEANLPSDWLAWDSGTSSYYVTTGTSELPTELVIPATYNDGTNGEHNVTYIQSAIENDEAVFYKQSITKVVFPSSFESIAGYAFSKCTLLEEVDFSACTKLKQLESSAFEYCSSLKSVDIPDTVEEIGAGVFYGCTSLVSISFPSALMAVSRWVCYGCTNLKEVDLTKSINLTSLSPGMFQDCSSLTSIIIPEWVTYIGDTAFSGCTNLTTVYNLSDLDIVAGASTHGGVALYATNVYTTLP